MLSNCFQLQYATKYTLQLSLLVLLNHLIFAILPFPSWFHTHCLTVLFCVTERCRSVMCPWTRGKDCPSDSYKLPSEPSEDGCCYQPQEWVLFGLLLNVVLDKLMSCRLVEMADDLGQGSNPPPPFIIQEIRSRKDREIGGSVEPYLFTARELDSRSNLCAVIYRNAGKQQNSTMFQQ